jgi:hypothetical protein
VVHQHVIEFLEFLFFYFSRSQIWLNPLIADDGHFWSIMKKKFEGKQKEIKVRSHHI